MPTTSKQRNPPSRRRPRAAAADAKRLPQLPLEPRQWAAVCQKLRLTPRQSDVLRLVLNDYSIKQISGILGIAVPTVNTNLQRIKDRNGRRGRMQLAMLVLEVAQSVKSRKCRSIR